MKSVSKCVVICSVIFALLLTTGCSTTPTRTVRITEYAAESPIISAATFGGCAIETTDDQIAGDASITYTGKLCNIEYSTSSDVIGE